MTTTILHSNSREVRIGFGQPFCVIGERINPTSRKLLVAAIAFSHGSANFPRLAQAIHLPAPPTTSTRRRQRR